MPDSKIYLYIALGTVEEPLTEARGDAPRWGPAEFVDGKAFGGRFVDQRINRVIRDN